jgi:Domain of unknown function (DUF4365)
MLTRGHCQEGLCRAYIQAVAARCGMSISVANPDYGIDLTLNEIAVSGNHHYESGLKIDVQAKTTVREGAKGSLIRYDLEVGAYRVLREPTGCPRILVLLELPQDETEWTAQTHERMSLRHCAYWLSLRGSGPTTNRRSVRLSIPRANVFSVTALQGLVQRVKSGGVV